MVAGRTRIRVPAKMESCEAAVRLDEDVFCPTTAATGDRCDLDHGAGPLPSRRDPPVDSHPFGIISAS